jgi:hypothetical protein
MAQRDNHQINWAAAIAPAIVGSIIATSLGIGLGYIISTQPDFSISVQPIKVIAPVPSEITAKILVKDLHHTLHKYQSQILLTASIVDGDQLQTIGNDSDIKVAFDPIGFDPLVSDSALNTSEMKISLGRNVKKGEYKIKIVGIGGDGKERSCIVVLKAI